MGSIESAASRTPNEYPSPTMDTSFEGVVEESRDGGKNAEALSIATMLAGGRPSKEYLESVRQGLAGEDH